MREIIYRYLEGKSTKEEEKTLLEWLRTDKNLSTFHKIKLDWKNGLNKNLLTDDSLKTWEYVQATILGKSYQAWHVSRKKQRYFAIAAAILFVAFILGSFYAGKFKSEQAGENWSKVMAENGQISKLELPDGTKVWLNSGSEISFSNFYGKKNRSVKLKGEGYFDVTENPSLPFLVSCNNLQIKVYGTCFNVSGRDDNASLEVVLEKGSIELTKEGLKSFRYKLKPGEMAKYIPQEARVSVSNVNTMRYTSWKEGILNIYDQNLKDVVDKLESRYNQSFEYDSEIENLRFTFTIKNEPLSDILQLMEKITPLKAIQKGSKIYLKRDKMKKIKTG